MIGHHVRRALSEKQQRQDAQAAQRASQRDDFDVFCWRQRARIRNRGLHRPAVSNDTTDPVYKAKATYPIERRGVGGGGGLPYGSRKINID